MATLAWVLVGISSLAGAVGLLGACVLGAVLVGSHVDSDRSIGLAIVAVGLLWAAVPALGWYLAFRTPRVGIAVAILLIHIAVAFPLTTFLLGGAEAAARP
jgi:hypothetical protein